MTIAECENTKLLVLNVEMTSTNKNTSSPVKVEVKGKSSRDLLFYHEIPAWYQDNIYIHYGHLLPGVLAIVCQGLLFQYFSWSYPQATARDQIMLAFYLCTTSICFGFSALYHTLLNHSAQIAALWGRIDYTGIIILILGDFVSGIYVGFYCEPVLQNTYWIMIVTLGVFTVYIVIHPSYQSRHYRLFRLSIFILTGLSAFAPIIHASSIFPLEQLNKQSGLPYYYAEGGLILLGALIYATRFPEKLYPGYFDIWGSSHQIFHIVVVLATLVHLYGVLDAFDWNYNNQRCGPSSGSV